MIFYKSQQLKLVHHRSGVWRRHGDPKYRTVTHSNLAKSSWAGASQLVDAMSIFPHSNCSGNVSQLSENERVLRHRETPCRVPVQQHSFQVPHVFAFHGNFLNPHNMQAAQTKPSEDTKMTNIFVHVTKMLFAGQTTSLS